LITDDEIRDVVIIPSVKYVKTDPVERRKQLELLLKRHGYDKIESMLTAEERVQYGPRCPTVGT
jgi:hypothetical protein